MLFVHVKLSQNQYILNLQNLTSGIFSRRLVTSVKASAILPSPCSAWTRLNLAFVICGLISRAKNKSYPELFHSQNHKNAITI